MHNDKILTDPKLININDGLQAILKKEMIFTTVQKKETNEKQIDF
jgi:hypothetical protein